MIDYKTGGYWPDDWKGVFAGGTRLQHALYGVAAEPASQGDRPKARVVRGRLRLPGGQGPRRSKGSTRRRRPR